MIEFHPEFLKKDGKNEFVVLPYDEFVTIQELLENAEDLLLLEQAKREDRGKPGVSLEEMMKRFGITPDLTCLGKIIGGGLPVGAFGGRAEIMDCLAPLGPVYQAGTLSGNPLAMAAGITALKELQSSTAYAQLEKLGAELEGGMRDAAKTANVAVQFNRIGSMFCGYFTEEPVHNLADAMKSDRARFAKFFHGMLAEGIYLAPSQFEAGFLSTAHTSADIERTVSAAARVMKAL